MSHLSHFLNHFISQLYQIQDFHFHFPSPHLWREGGCASAQSALSPPLRCYVSLSGLHSYP